VPDESGERCIFLRNRQGGKIRVRNSFEAGCSRQLRMRQKQQDVSPLCLYGRPRVNRLARYFRAVSKGLLASLTNSLRFTLYRL
jgi:hypothetical protein